MSKQQAPYNPHVPPPSNNEPPPQYTPSATQPGYPQPGYPSPGYGPPGPIQMQPTAGGYPQPGQQFSNVALNPQQAMWMPLPQNIPNCPPGLEYLAMIDQILVHQQVEGFEMFANIETENKYRIKNNMGQDIYFATEDSGFCSRYCLGARRPFEIKIMDNFGKEVIHLKRPYRCDCCCCCCCLQKIEVYTPVNELVGYVVQNWALCSPSFSIQNANSDDVLKISGPCCLGCACCDCGDRNFHVLSLDGKKVGKIQKQWSGVLQEVYTDADNFGITFPMDLDVRMKAVMLGSCFLIDYMYFEENQVTKST